MDQIPASTSDANADGPTATTIKRFMGRTPSVIKSKFLSVLGNSTDLINGISNKIDAALSLSTSSEETETTANRNQAKVQAKLDASKHVIRQNTKEADSLDFDTVDFDYRKVKERRAIEEIQCGRYRQPTFVASKSTAFASSPEKVVEVERPTRESNSSTETDYSNSIDSPSPRPEIDLEFLEQVNVVRMAIEGNTEFNKADGKENLEQKPAKAQHEFLEPSHSMDRLGIAIPSSSASTSDNDPCIADVSFESADIKNWIRSESYTSVPSWASSISLDSQSEEVALEFMRTFVTVLFTDSASMTMEMKSDFGQYARTETGRLWFSRLLNVQRVKSKKVDEMTFYALIQYFAIILFECMESDDFSPAKNLMNMCFTFYHEVDVPGCEPYPEYLYTYLKDQPIWHSLRFWNAAFFDALQSQRAHRPVPATNTLTKENTKDPVSASKSSEANSLPQSENDVTSIASSVINEIELEEDKQFQQNITFGQLGTFTCNMHAFGLSRDLTNEFLRKQCIIANLSKEQVKLLQDNVNRMYRETDPWRK